MKQNAPGTRWARIAAPAAFMLLGIWLLVGCVYVPTFDKVVTGRNAAKKVGDARSRRPLRVTRSELADVLRVLGEPRFATADRRVLAYPWTVRNGVAVWPLCLAAYPVKGQRTLVLRFDDRDVLRSFEILKRNDPVVQISAMGFTVPLPPEIEREMAAESRLVEQRRRATTQSSSRPVTDPDTQPR